MFSERSIGSASSYKPPKKNSSIVLSGPKTGSKPKQSSSVVLSGPKTGSKNQGYTGAKIAAAAAQGAITPSYSAPVNAYSGSDGGYSGGGYSGGGGGGSSVAPSVFNAASVIPSAAPAYVAPAVIADAAASANNVAGESFNKFGTGAGSFGQEQRRRLARGPTTGLSVTPEMLRRAAMNRLG